jgi:hypothetical protein
MDVNVNVLRNRQAERFVVTADCYAVCFGAEVETICH